jgi:hypothetical protein
LDYLFGALILLVGRHNGFAAQIWTDIKSALGAFVFAADQGLGQVIDKTFLLEGLAQKTNRFGFRHLSPDSLFGR